MKIEMAANQLAELGHVTRLEIYRILVRAGHHGLAVSAIQEKLDIPGSTLSHHISRLVKVGLLSQTREGRVLRCQAQYQELERLIAFLSEECCKGCD
ncbi:MULTISPECIES: ArsR/SmtB family transcription factor [Pseudoalteromonas]|uniref:Transcriptional regulator n=1 Tax=Pseudoalteromonas amylolytica TaxID=1859457 RepID=A0A1S1MT75_9GAMM|nr:MULTISPECIES: helix-turn-helix domain-containing protein [Pseudoalteromonas]OHU84345.1 transcriptional regulator [Pseudoalteromonas sp. JW3]OHU87116.1 transcriptional regulator [Pseudoalteromonas amylolytica]